MTPYSTRTAAPTSPQPAGRPARSHCQTSQPPPISQRPARTKRITERATVMAWFRQSVCVLASAQSARLPPAPRASIVPFGDLGPACPPVPGARPRGGRADRLREPQGRGRRAARAELLRALPRAAVAAVGANLLRRDGSDERPGGRICIAYLRADRPDDCAAAGGRPARPA